LQQTIEEIKKLKPKRAFLVGNRHSSILTSQEGMGHGLEHNQTNNLLEERGKTEGFVAECAYDFMGIPFSVQ
jgi:hypothetical protein